jgi:hypothetical protein
MHPYTFRRLTERPDAADIREEARASYVGQLPRPGGEFRSCTRNAAARAVARRRLKRIDRAKAAHFDREAEVRT